MGAGFCSLYPKIHYIEVRYIEIWMYFVSCDSKGSVVKIKFASSDIIGMPYISGRVITRTWRFEWMGPLMSDNAIVVCIFSIQILVNTI